MKRARIRRLAAAALAPVLACGCSTVPVLPPVTAYRATGCASAPDLSGAVSLTPERQRRIFTVENAVDRSTPCLQRGATATPYVVYALPEDAAGTMVEVGARLEAARIFSPAVATLDRAGNQVRSFVPDQYLYRGSIYSVQFVPIPDERYILVTADPDRIGRRYDAIAISTSTTPLVSPYGVANWTSGVDQSISRTFSYDGMVAAIVHRPQVEER